MIKFYGKSQPRNELSQSGWPGGDRRLPRDPKGLYAKARAGQIKEFTGISSPYEAPENAELRIDTGGQELQQSVEIVISTLQDRGVIPAA